MSANNWTTCPKCKRKKEDAAERLRKKALAAYGTVSAGQYADMLGMARDAKEVPLQNSMREDYELGVDSEGRFSIAYRANCTACGFIFDYDRTETALPQGGKA